MKNLKEQLEIDFLKSLTYTEINSIMNDFKVKIENLEKQVKLNLPKVIRQSEQFFCGVKGGFCPYEEVDNKCSADFECVNRLTK